MDAMTNTKIFEGFAGRRLGIEPKPEAAGGPYVRLGIGGQDIYLKPTVALEAARALARASEVRR